jgi:hypothetical protein
MSVSKAESHLRHQTRFSVWFQLLSGSPFPFLASLVYLESKPLSRISSFSAVSIYLRVLLESSALSDRSTVGHEPTLVARPDGKAPSARIVGWFRCLKLQHSKVEVASLRTQSQTPATLVSATICLFPSVLGFPLDPQYASEPLRSPKGVDPNCCSGFEVQTTPSLPLPFDQKSADEEP